MFEVIRPSKKKQPSFSLSLSSLNGSLRLVWCFFFFFFSFDGSRDWIVGLLIWYDVLGFWSESVVVWGGKRGVLEFSRTDAVFFSFFFFFLYFLYGEACRIPFYSPSLTLCPSSSSVDFDHDNTRKKKEAFYRSGYRNLYCIVCMFVFRLFLKFLFLYYVYGFYISFGLARLGVTESFFFFQVLGFWSRSYSLSLCFSVCVL